MIEIAALIRHMDSRFESMEMRMDRLENKLDRVDLRTLETQETLEVLVAAVEKDALALMNHEGRIAGLEETNGIHTVTPAHLRDFED